jgi:hypothetical protein
LERIKGLTLASLFCLLKMLMLVGLIAGKFCATINLWQLFWCAKIERAVLSPNQKKAIQPFEAKQLTWPFLDKSNIAQYAAWSIR